MKAKSEIPVVLSTDKNFVFPSFVVMASILKNADTGSFFHFYFLSYDDIEKTTAPLERKLQRHFTCFDFKIITIDKAELKSAQIVSKHLTLSAYNRIFIVELLPEWDKCIYLDGDVLVNGNLAELYRMDLAENYLLGVKDCHLLIDSEENRKHRESLGLESFQNYVNSGVLVMNLAKMRVDNLARCFREQIKRENKMEDQDVLNVCCYGKIGIMPLKYNLFHFYYGNTFPLLRNYPYVPQEYDFDPCHPFILHMANAYKPWHGNCFKGASQWWDMASLFSELEIYQDFQKKSEEEALKWDIRALFSRCRLKKYIVIWGFSGYAKMVVSMLKRNRIENITYFCDNNKEYRNQCYDGIPIVEMEHIAIPYRDILWVISCQQSYQQVVQQLTDSGVKEEWIFRYIYKHWPYYRSLEPGWYEDELRQIMAQEYGLEHEQNFYQKFPENRKRNESEQKEYERLAKQYRFQDWLDLKTIK